MTKKNFVLLFIVNIIFCSIMVRSMELNNDDITTQLKQYFDNSSAFNEAQKDALSKMVKFQHIDKIFPFEKRTTEEEVLCGIPNAYLLKGAWYFRKSDNENVRTLVMISYEPVTMGHKIIRRLPEIIRVPIVYNGEKYVLIKTNKSYATLIDILTEFKNTSLNFSKYVSPKEGDVQTPEDIMSAWLQPKRPPKRRV